MNLSGCVLKFYRPPDSGRLGITCLAPMPRVVGLPQVGQRELSTGTWDSTPGVVAGEQRKSPSNWLIIH